MPPPDWFAQPLQQFPVVALVVLVAWLQARWTNARHRDELARLDRLMENNRQQAHEEKAAIRRDHEAERGRAEKAHARLVTHLRTQIRALERRLMPGESE